LQNLEPSGLGFPHSPQVNTHEAYARQNRLYTGRDRGGPVDPSRAWRSGMDGTMRADAQSGIASVGAEGVEPRPSPCKGEKYALVSSLTCGNGLSLSMAQYLRASPRCYAKCYAD
jgi:hypothetical protein